jgi:hypothetical protein
VSVGRDSAGSAVGRRGRGGIRGGQASVAIRVAFPFAGVAASSALVVLIAGCLGCYRAANAEAFVHPGVTRPSSADAPAAPARPSAGAQRAPSKPPLIAGAGQAGAPEAGEGTVSQPQGEVDPLVSNGLGSPLCKRVLGEGELPPARRRDCETSGFVAAAAPTGNYGIDVHIDTGVLGLSSGGLLSIVQDLFVTPAWMALVWVVHALVVMLEWCFTVDLLDSAAASGVAGGLRQMQLTLTQPWLASVLAIASVLAVYNGLIRRRVAETAGQALLMMAMMAAGMWVIADPAATVEALGRWANRASLGTLAVAARGTPGDGTGALAQSMDTVFAAAVEAPWCYLEFGDVDWCRSPSRLDSALRAAGLKLAADELALIGCRVSFKPCVSAGSSAAKALERSARLLREAQSNGAIFLALPANGPARNSINEQGSLLRAICQSSEATNCRGAAAAQAEFRTGSATWSRVGGLLLIVAGVLGMMLLLGFIAIRLLTAAIFSLLYLLLAPAMVLAPALGDGGRAVFRKWATQLLGAVVSKLLFSFLLGVVLAVLAILSELGALGWWTQWLLMSAFWWGAYARRHQALGFAEGGSGRERSRSTHGPRSLARRMSEALEPPRRAIGAARWTMSKFAGQVGGAAQGPGDIGRPAGPQARKRAQGTDSSSVGQAAQIRVDEQARRILAHELSEARSRMTVEPELQRRVVSQRARLERIQRERGRALAGGDIRRADELGHRGSRIETDIHDHEETLNASRRLVGDGERALGRDAGAHATEQLRQRERFLDAQAALPAAARVPPGAKPTERRDYGALAALAGYGREEYANLDSRRQRSARLEVDRELALRTELGGSSRITTEGLLGPRSRQRGTPGAEGAPPQRVRGGAQDRSSVRGGASGFEHRGEGGPLQPRSETLRPADERSSVMSDAREVAARRKRQLGRGRP